MEDKISFLNFWLKENCRKIDEELCRKRDWPSVDGLYQIYCKSAHNSAPIGAVSKKDFIGFLIQRGVKTYKNHSVCNIRLFIP